MLLINLKFPGLPLLCKLGKPVFCLVQNLSMGCFAVWSDHVIAAAPPWLREQWKPRSSVSLCVPGHILSARFSAQMWTC